MANNNAPPSRWRLVNVRNNTDQLKQLKLERASHTATVVGDSIYVVGGRRGSSTFYGDCLRFDTTTSTWSVVAPAIPNDFRPRANHTATLVGGRQLWVVAGSDNECVFSDVHVLDINTLKWTKVQLRGDTSLLQRTAHSAELHPVDPTAILLFGGYGGGDVGGQDSFHNDLFILRTNTLTVERVITCGGLPTPAPRAYHSCTALGGRCYIYGGRTEATVVEPSQMLAVYDAVANRWVAPAVAGPWPAGRSSHRAVALGDRQAGLLIHGGAGGSESSERLSDVHSLAVCGSTGRLRWSREDEPTGTASQSRPQGRSAHTLSLVGRDRVYMISGYLGQPGPGGQRYSGEMHVMLLGTPAGEPLPAVTQPPSPTRQRQQRPPSPVRAPSPQPQPQAQGQGQGQGQQAARSPREGGAGASGRSGMPSPSPPPPPVAQPVPSALSSRPSAAAGGRRLPGSTDKATGPLAAAAAAPAPAAAAVERLRLQQTRANAVPAAAAAAAAAAGAGAADEDPIDLTLDAAASPLKAHNRRPAAQRGRTGNGHGADAAAAEGAWLGGGRRGRAGGPLLKEPSPPPPPQPAAAGAAGMAAAIDGRAAKRPATEAAVAATRSELPAAPAAAPPAAPPLGPPLLPPIHAPLPQAPLQRPPSPPRPAPTHAYPQPAVAAGGGLLYPTGYGIHAAPPSPPHAGSSGSGPMVWQTEVTVNGIPPGSGPDTATIAAAATAAATAAVAATCGAQGPGGSGGGGGPFANRPPSPSHAGAGMAALPASMGGGSQDTATVLALFQQMREQLATAQESERRAQEQSAALQDRARRAEEELGSARRSWELAAAELRAAQQQQAAEAQARAQEAQARAALEAERSTLRQQLAAEQAAVAALTGQVAEARNVLGDRQQAVQALADELRKERERIRQLEAERSRQAAELSAARTTARDLEQRRTEEAAALGERLSRAEQDRAELGAQLRAAASRNTEQESALARSQDARQRAERDLAEAREAVQRLTSRLDQEVGELSRQRDHLSSQLTHANNKAANVEAELRRVRDDVAHLEQRLAGLTKANTDQATEISGLREQLRAATAKYDTLRQQLALWQSHVQSVNNSGAALAQALNNALSSS